MREASKPTNISEIQIFQSPNNQNPYNVYNDTLHKDLTIKTSSKFVQAHFYSNFLNHRNPFFQNYLLPLFLIALKGALNKCGSVI